MGAGPSALRFNPVAPRRGRPPQSVKMPTKRSRSASAIPVFVAELVKRSAENAEKASPSRYPVRLINGFQKWPRRQPVLAPNTLFIDVLLAAGEAGGRPQDQIKQVIEAKRRRDLAAILVIPPDGNGGCRLRPDAHGVGDRGIGRVVIALVHPGLVLHRAWDGGVR